MKKNSLYSISIIVLGFLFRIIDGKNIDTLNPEIGQLLWLITPLLIGLIFHYSQKEKSNWGLRFRFKESWHWYLISFLIFPLLLLLLTAIGVSIGSTEQLTSMWTTGFMVSVLLAIPALLVKNIFEEFVWRGFLFSRLEKQKVPRLNNHLIIGVIWAAWHFPYIDGFTQTYHTMVWQIYVPLFFAGILVTAIIYGEIRKRSGTVWTALILHTMANGFVNTLFHENYIQLNEGKEWLVAPTIDNLGYILIVGIVGVCIYKLIPEQ